ncbi:DUF2946 domain-containing protein [Herbaspirillum sp. C7C8]|uniref:DUF2946 domain-containing protein n=1 Tax=Herbaspirillum sp. C7C8 TaxID=2736665 RepID=UPI001F51FEA6|nr:DUF2946 domain-containing protein [Herbaspirillum sp. C7C8]MCI1007567.1 DUF2946 domain-containing protein [Herbaspirillum sp. C7C8]
MSLSKRLHRLIAWLALCVMLFVAAAPSISRALASNSQISWMEVCSATGIKRTTAPANNNAGQEQMPVDKAHCGYCVLQQHTPALASAAPGIALLVAVLAYPLFYMPDVTVVRTLVPTAHRSRAPPSCI